MARTTYSAKKNKARLDRRIADYEAMLRRMPPQYHKAYTKPGSMSK